MSKRREYSTNMAKRLLMIADLNNSNLLAPWREDMEHLMEMGYEPPSDLKSALILFDNAQAENAPSHTLATRFKTPSKKATDNQWQDLYHHLNAYVAILEDLTESELSVEQILAETKAIITSAEWDRAH